MRWQFCFSVQARSGNILQHLAAELRRAEASGNVDRLVSSGGGNVPRGATYPAPGQGVRRRQSDPDFLAQIAGGQPAQSSPQQVDIAPQRQDSGAPTRSEDLFRSRDAFRSRDREPRP